MAPRPEVSGRAFLGIIRYVKDARGESALRDIIDRTPEVHRVFDSTIRILDWHPYGAYTAFLRSVCATFGGGDATYARKLGEAAGAKDLGTMFRVYAALASAERLIRGSGKVWPSYYRGAGSMDAIAWTPDDTRLRINDFPSMTLEHCRLMEGWMVTTMRQIGFEVIGGGAETACTSRGDAHHEFACKWRKVK